MKINHLILILFTCPLLTKAQNLTGTWVGHSDNSFVKLVVIHKGDSLLGYTFDKKPGYCQATFLGIYNRSTKFLSGTNVAMLRNSGEHKLSTYDLNYFKEGGREKLIGKIKSKENNSPVLALGASRIYLRKEKSDVDTIAYMQPFIDKTGLPYKPK